MLFSARLRNMSAAFRSPFRALLARSCTKASALVICLRTPPCDTEILAVRASLMIVALFLQPLGRPLGFPERPFGNRVVLTRRFGSALLDVTGAVLFVSLMAPPFRCVSQPQAHS